MCLRVVYGIYKGLTPGMETRFKVFMKTEEGELYPLFLSNLDKGPLPLGQWLDEKYYRPPDPHDKIKSHLGTFYPTGWHVYVDEDRANAIASSVDERRIALKVYCKGLLADGEDVHGFVNEVYRYIKIERES